MITFAQKIHEIIAQGIPLNNRMVNNLAADFGITNPTIIKELTELGIVQNVREIAQNIHNQSIKSVYHQIVQSYKNQNILKLRTQDSMFLQQYSTPVPIAFLAQVYCGLHLFTKNQKVFEPTAGNGAMLTIANTQNCHANEIDENRLQNLKTQQFAIVTNQDATIPYPDEYLNQYDAVIGNPPFGVMHHKQYVNANGFTITDIDHLITINALDCMKDNGKAAFIIGGHTHYDKAGRVRNGKNRNFLMFLYRFYNVEADIPIDGSLYARQGTSFDIRLLLINGRKQTEGGFPPLKNEDNTTIITTFNELYNEIMIYVDEPKNSIIIEKLANVINSNTIKPQPNVI